MVLHGCKKALIQELKKEVLALQSIRKPVCPTVIQTGLEAAFPDNIFPLGVIHEFLSYTNENAAATSGFISGLLSMLLKNNGTCVWISTKCTVFPVALRLFGIKPEQIIFIDCKNRRDLLWAIEEALKCEVVSAVVGELSELSFKESRRLQLAVEQSNVTGFIHRYRPRTENIVACVTRWKINPLPSELEEGMPGVGFPHWHVQLLKVRNGKPGVWDIQWLAEKFRYTDKESYILSEAENRKAV